MNFDFDWIANRRLVFNVVITAFLIAVVPVIPLMFAADWRTWAPTLTLATVGGVVQRLLKTPQALDRREKLKSGELLGARAEDRPAAPLPPTEPVNTKKE